MKRLAMSAAACALLAGTAAAQQPAPNPGAADKVDLGVLTCRVSGGVGFVVGSTKELQCEFAGVDGGPVETYVGNIKRVGLDIGVTGPSIIVWGVLAPSKDYAPGMLAGTYGGVGVQATAIVGAGANVLIGGSENTFTLQPVSVEGTTGLNIAAGIGEIELISAN